MIAPSATPPTIGRSTEIPQGITTSGTASSTVAPAAETGAGLASAWPSPSLRLDPALGIVVMEFRDKSGGVASTLPTQRELEAYRSAASRPRASTAGPVEGAASPAQAQGQPGTTAIGAAGPEAAAVQRGPEDAAASIPVSATGRALTT